jgi:UDP-N-acetylglucosamine--N-acetylmuramyl-(pentapeptide) pyrophosphoryl-undecaprenol N-acetylglucosamine transferase
MNGVENIFETLKTQRVAIITGGTAGHVIPAGDLAYYLNNAQVYVNEKGSKFCNLNNKIVYHLENKSIFNMIAQIIYFLFELRSYDVVIGFGAFMTIPALIAAKILGKTVYTHEQNAIDGDANQFLRRLFGIKILQSFNVNENDLTGFPVLETPNNNYVISQESPLLVLSGSGGSQFFDDVLFPIISKWAEANNQLVYFQCKHKSTNHVICSPFFENYMELIEKSKCIISRSGTSSLSKFMLLKKQVLLIPSRYVVNNHQYYNAKNSGFPYIEEQDINEETFIDKLNTLLQSSENSLPKSSLNLFIIPQKDN